MSLTALAQRAGFQGEVNTSPALGVPQLRRRTQQPLASSAHSLQALGRSLGAGSGAGLNAERQTSHFPVAVVVVTTDSDIRKSCCPTPGKGIGVRRERRGPAECAARCGRSGLEGAEKGELLKLLRPFRNAGLPRWRQCP